MKRLYCLSVLLVAAIFTSCKKDNSTPNSTTTTNSETNGDIYTVAGISYSGYAGDGGLAVAAELQFPSGVALDPSGNIYIADNGNSLLRKVTTDGIILTIAGIPSSNNFLPNNSGYSGDAGPATAAELNGPNAVAVDSHGNIYVADVGNDRVRKINSLGIISTFAGNGTFGSSGDGGSAIAAELYNPTGVAADLLGNVYIADCSNCRIRRVSPSGIISTIAGNGTKGFSGDSGAATAAEMNDPFGIAVDISGNIYFSDGDNNRIRFVNTNGIISTIAGNGSYGFSGDGGPATAAELYAPRGVAVDVNDNVYIADQSNNRIRIIYTNGIISTFAGNGYGTPTAGSYSGDGGPATLAGLNVPNGVAADHYGSIYIAEGSRIRMVYK
jgi:sugar lactone lactonase YvrE